MPIDNQPVAPGDQNGGVVSIEKAILLDVCLGVPLGRIWLRMPAWQAEEPLPSGPSTTLFRGEQLGLLKKMHLRGDEETAEAMTTLTRMADAALERGPFSVTPKTGMPATDDPHDYYSLAKYWWPNEESGDGQPYVKRDGYVNPECYSDQYDFVELEAFSEAVLLLALAAYLTDKPEYGQHASRLLSAWFVDQETKQNPTFECAQAIPGKQAGRWQGVIEARRFIYVTEAVHLLEAANLLSSETSTAIRRWYADFLDWLTDSAHGQEASARKNNIAFWCDLQRMVYADFCGRDGLATEIAIQVSIPRLDEQLAEDGSLPAEILRAQPHDYVAFTVMAMAMISSVGEKHGLDLWDPREADGQNFRVAHDWLLRTTRSHELVDKLWSEQTAYQGTDEPPSDNNLSASALIDLGLQLRGARHVAEYRNSALQRTRAELDQERARNAELQSQCACAGDVPEADAKTGAEANHDTRHSPAEENYRNVKDSEGGRSEGEHAEDDADATGALRAQLEAREHEIDRLHKQFAAERDYLQAQLDTANAMWGFYADGGKPPALHSSSASSVSSEQSSPGSDRSKGPDTPGQSGEGEVSQKDKHKVRDMARYAIELEAQYMEMMSSRSWRLTGPVRVMLRNAPRVLLRPPRQGNQWPKRPKLLREAARHRGEGSEALPGLIDQLSARRLARHRSELERYALTLEKKVRAVFGAGTWKVAAPLRESVRIYRRVVKRQDARRGRLPRRPAGLEDKK